MSSPWLTSGTTSFTPAARRSRSAGESSWSPSSATGPGALIRYMTSGSLGAMSTRGVSAVRCEGRAMEWSVARADEAVGSDPRPRTQRSDRAKLSISTSFYGPGVRKALRGSPLGPQGDHVDGLDGTKKAFERQRRERLGLDEILDEGVGALAQEDLPALCLGAQARGEVHDRPHGAVVGAAGEADPPEGRVAERDPDAEVEVVPALSPAGHELTDELAHGHRHADRPRGRVRARHGIVEERENRVAGEALERRLVLEHERTEGVVVLAQHAHDLLGRGDLRERGEAAEIAEHGGDLAPMALEELLVVRDDLGDLRREEATQTLDPLELLDLLRDARDERLGPVGELRGLFLDRGGPRLDAHQRPRSRDDLRRRDIWPDDRVRAGFEPRDAEVVAGRDDEHRPPRAIVVPGDDPPQLSERAISRRVEHDEVRDRSDVGRHIAERAEGRGEVSAVGRAEKNPRACGDRHHRARSRSHRLACAGCIVSRTAVSSSARRASRSTWSRRRSASKSRVRAAS